MNLSHITSQRSPIRPINLNGAVADEDLLAEIGYKQELARRYSTLQIFGVAFSIMGLLPSIATTMSIGLEAGPAGLVWGWLISGVFILVTGILVTIFGSAIPTSGGLYYYTNYFAPESIRVGLSFLIGCSNSLGLIGGICLILYGFSVQVLSAIYVTKNGNFEITAAKTYGVFAAAVISVVFLCSVLTKRAAKFQTVSIVANVLLIILYFIVLPIGAGRKNGFNDGKYIFADFSNTRTWSTGWSFMLLWMPAIWTIGAFDSVIHCSEEARNAQRAIPYGILGSISVCWIVGWFICIVACACIKNGDTATVLKTDTGSVMAQILYDALGRRWCIAFMLMILLCQYLMGTSIVIAASRQIWAFARDDGFPVIYEWVKFVNPVIKEPIRAVIVTGVVSLVMGLLVLIGPAGSNALFSLSVTSVMLAWGMPAFLVLLPTGRARFVPGPFNLGETGNLIVWYTAVLWVVYAIIMSMFPDTKQVDAHLMNYTVAINAGVWVLSLAYFYVHGCKVYIGPKSNLDPSIDGESCENLDAVMLKGKK